MTTTGYVTTHGAAEDCGIYLTKTKPNSNVHFGGARNSSGSLAGTLLVIDRGVVWRRDLSPSLPLARQISQQGPNKPRQLCLLEKQGQCVSG